MSRQFDFASDMEARERDSVVAAKREEIAYITQPAFSHCADCGEEIAKERQLISGVTRCIECQRILESMEKRGLR